MTGHSHFDRSLSIYSLLSSAHRQGSHELFTRLSRESPVHWDAYAAAWLVAGFPEVRTVLTSPNFSAMRITTGRQSTAPSGSALDRAQEIIARQALFLDGARHDAWRTIIRSVVTPARVDILTPWIRTRITQMIESGTGARRDVVDDLARPLPLEVIGRLLGLPPGDLPAIGPWSDAYTRVVTGFEPERNEDVFEAVVEFADYCAEIVRQRRRIPTDDGAGLLVRGADASGLFDDTDIAANLLMLIAAGHQTTTGLLAGAVLERIGPTFGPLHHRSDGPDEVEDLLTRVSPSRFVGRTVVANTELGGQELLAGQSVLVLLAAANWQLLDAETGSHRATRRSVAFGYGRHHCPGAHIARLECRLILEELFRPDRSPVLLDPEIAWSENVNLPCPQHIPIQLMKGAADHAAERGTSR
ncbi:hypothetical protein ABZV91_11985 [Nocardia sp. NPDC004568]|uniref:cytochrome P450 n=1 Tax=Nocardia sp. NPDC004568 TaxID=3154551 RepID=UPI0033B8247B